MPLTISDDVLQSAGLTETEARIEIACRLFDADKLTLWSAVQFAEMTRLEFEEELRRRNIPIYRPTVEDLQADLAAFETLEYLTARARRGSRKEFEAALKQVPNVKPDHNDCLDR